MERDPNFNPVFPYPPAPLPPPSISVPDEVLMTAYSYVKSLNASFGCCRQHRFLLFIFMRILTEWRESQNKKVLAAWVNLPALLLPLVESAQGQPETQAGAGEKHGERRQVENTENVRPEYPQPAPLPEGRRMSLCTTVRDHINRDSVNIIAKPARHHGSTHLNRQKELVIVKLSGNIPDKSREVAKFVRKGQRKVPPSVDLSSLPLRTARSSSPERDSGSSTVAIDNKIEQAMDLVKSHLMYAVREEVEVLKEQIKELMERLSQLEYENNILRAAATPDTLAKLTPQTQPSQPPPSSSS
ncbi:hypothetical protein BaRGS_00037343 [Batillaria attramentaria]|uniref:Uncharacterized protein n=1 Tax=Batillaria attramentaria TaxID=370345 RepID=A0ABD0J8Y0_9CAEN